MDTKHIHCMLENMAEYGKCMIESAVGEGSVNLDDAGKIIDMVKDLACAEKDALIAREMRKAHEEEEQEEKYMLKRFKEEYGEEDGERRYYDDYRYKRSGRFAPKGRGSYMPRRGYEEPPYYHMTPEMYREHDPEYYRDMDRKSGRLYFSTPTMNDTGRSDMGMSGRDGREGRSGMSRRGYVESREIHKGNTPEDKTEKMRSLEEYLKDLSVDITELVGEMDNSEKTMLKSKMQTLIQKIN